jgi:hypothetical protein
MFKGLNELEREVGEERKTLWERIPLPLKFFIVFAAVSYIVQMYLTYSPPSGLRLSGPAEFVLAYSVCPVCILIPTVDPTLSDIAYFIGPIDALIHGAIGAMIGYFIEAFF